MTLTGMACPPGLISPGDRAILQAFADGMKACRAAGHRIGQSLTCTTCRRELGFYRPGF